MLRILRPVPGRDHDGVSSLPVRLRRRYETVGAALADLDAIEQLHQDELIGQYDAAVIDQEHGKPHVVKRITPLLPTHRSGSWRDVGPGREHYFPPVRVLVGDTSVGLPVIDLGNRAGTRGGEPSLHSLPGGSIRQVEHKLIQAAARVRSLPSTDDLQVNLAVWQSEDGPVQAIAVVEGLQDR